MSESTNVRMTLNYILDLGCAKYGDGPAIGMAMEAPLSYRRFHHLVHALAVKMQQEGW